MEQIWGRVTVVSATGTVTDRWTIGGIGQPDLTVVDALMRWQLDARRVGGSIRLVAAQDELLLLLRFLGLLWEVGGEPEERKEWLRIQE